MCEGMAAAREGEALEKQLFGLLLLKVMSNVGEGLGGLTGTHWNVNVSVRSVFSRWTGENLRPNPSA